jgi:hypothetical protein
MNSPPRVDRPEPPARTAPSGWGALALVLAGGLLLRPDVLFAPFFADDWLFLDQARARSLLHALGSPDPIGNFARPLGRQAWFWVMGRLSGESPVAFHAASLAMFLLGIALLFVLARRLAGTGAAVVAAGYLALHHSADVPLTWASGSQDLISVTFGIGAILAFTGGRRALAAVLLFLGLLAKETIVLAPLTAVLLARRPGESWRATATRGWPFLFAWLGWAGVAAGYAARGRLHGAGEPIAPLHAVAALWNLVRAAIGLEWRTASLPFVPFHPPTVSVLAAISLVLAALLWQALARTAAPVEATAPSRSAARRPPGRREARHSAPAPARAKAPRVHDESARRAMVAGIVWAITAGLPVMAVAPIWSAYYYLFAMAGVGLALGAWLGRRPWVGGTVLVVLALTCHQARVLDEFQTGRSPWSGQSHVNGLYLQRGMSIVAAGLADLRAAHPTLPAGSTVFLAGIPPFAAFQVGDGPLVRGVYRDTSLRAYYLSDFNAERARRGPSYFLFYDKARRRLIDQTADPQILVRIALGQMLSDHDAVAETAIEMQLEKRPDELVGRYLGAFLARQLGRVERSDSLLHAAGLSHHGPGDVPLKQALTRLASGDTLGAASLVAASRYQYVLDPRLHALLADLYLPHDATASEGTVEAYIARVLAPRWGMAWRRWAACQIRTDRNLEAARSLDRYFELEPRARVTDTEAVHSREGLNRILPGGDLAQRSLHGTAQR